MVDKGGRPTKWETAEELQAHIDDYFNTTQENRLTITGLCLHLDCNKQTLYNYNAKPEFKAIVDKARMRVENSYELSLREHGRSGDIFALKNFGWTDKQEIEHSGGVNIVFDKDDKDLL